MKNILKFKKSIFTIVAITVTVAQVVNAQDVRFTQAISNPLNLNPAMMGLNSDLKFALQYRNQWGSIDKGYSTYSFTTLLPVYKKEDGSDKIDLGFNATNDVAGAYNSLNVSLAAGYNLKISESSFLNLSFLGGMVQRTIKTSNLTFDQQYVNGSYNSSNANNETVLNKKVTFADISFGGMWYCAPVKISLGKERNMSAYLGGAAFHLNTPPNESFSGGTASLPSRYTLQGGVKIIGEKFDLTPNFYTNTQGGNTNVTGSLLVDYKVDVLNTICFGAWYRSKDAMAFGAGYNWLMVRLMYSYDIAHTSPISNSSAGLQTHEITLSISFGKAKERGVKVVPSF